MLLTLTCGRKPDHEEIYDTGNDKAINEDSKRAAFLYCIILLESTKMFDDMFDFSKKRDAKGAAIFYGYHTTVILAVMGIIRLLGG
tara:strand:- start:13372 stop:13629 length:258 start_codon:yes stop_codon:yes gene_type:complete